jgi:hypothetical protein
MRYVRKCWLKQLRVAGVECLFGCALNPRRGYFVHQRSLMAVGVVEGRRGRFKTVLKAVKALEYHQMLIAVSLKA